MMSESVGLHAGRNDALKDERRNDDEERFFLDVVLVEEKKINLFFEVLLQLFNKPYRKLQGRCKLSVDSATWIFFR